MSGHNKWSQIKRQKGAEDAKKSKRFSMLARAITIEAKRANGDRNASGLKTAIEKARAEDVPNENIERAVKNALGADASSLTQVLYEAYGPGGVAMMIEGITDNKNRTSQEIKHILNQHGSALANPGSVTWAFNNKQPFSPIPLNASARAILNTLLTDLNDQEDVETVITNATS